MCRMGASIDSKKIIIIIMTPEKKKKTEWKTDQNIVTVTPQAELTKLNRIIGWNCLKVLIIKGQVCVIQFAFTL